MDSRNIHRTCKECGGTLVHKARFVKGKVKNRLECARCGQIQPNSFGEEETE